MALQTLVTTAVHYSPKDPFSLLESCQKALQWILITHRDKPIRRCWIDHPYGEEEIMLLEDELLPVIEQVLQRVQAIDADVQAQFDAECQAYCQQAIAALAEANHTQQCHSTPA